jgi:hypothetical protein
VSIDAEVCVCFRCIIVSGELADEVKCRVEERAELEQEHQKLLAEKKKAEAELASLLASTKAHAREEELRFVSVCFSFAVFVPSPQRLLPFSNRPGLVPCSLSLVPCPGPTGRTRTRSLLLPTFTLCAVPSSFVFLIQASSKANEDRSVGDSQQATPSRELRVEEGELRATRDTLGVAST